MLLLFAILLLSCNNNNNNDNKQTYYQNGNIREVFEVIIKDGDTYKTGSYKSYFSNGQIMAIGKLEQNAPIGFWRYFKPDGGLFTEGSYSHDNSTIRKDYKEFIIDEVKYELEYFSSGQIGKWTYNGLYEDGKEYTEDYDSHETLNNDGIRVSKTANGMLSIAEFRNGLKNGREQIIMLNESNKGVLLEEINNINGSAVYNRIFNYKENLVHEREFYKDSVKFLSEPDTKYLYSISTQDDRIFEYKPNKTSWTKYDGDNVYYDYNGNVSEEAFTIYEKHNIKTSFDEKGVESISGGKTRVIGKLKKYHTNGNLKVVFNYDTFIKKGYFDDGTINFIASFIENGVTDENFKLYNETGELTATGVYDNGKIASIKRFKQSYNEDPYGLFQNSKKEVKNEGRCYNCRLGLYTNGTCNYCGAASPSKVNEVYKKLPNCYVCKGSRFYLGRICSSCRGSGKYVP